MNKINSNSNPPTNPSGNVTVAIAPIKTIMKSAATIRGISPKIIRIPPTVSIVATMIAKNPGIERLMKNSSTPSIPPENFVTPCKRNTRPKATLSMTSLHLFMGRDLLTRRDNTYLLVHMFLVFHFIKLQLFSSSVVTKSVICCVFINYKYSAIKKNGYTAV